MKTKVNVVGVAQKGLSWREILLEEGVYKSTINSDKDSRIIVIKGSFRPAVTFYVNISNGTVATPIEDWERHSFFKTNEEIEITFK